MSQLFPFYSIGHFINQPNSHTNFEIVLFEDMPEPEVDEIHKHSFYEILWTEDGSSKQTIDYKDYEVQPNSLFFISPNQVHQFEEWRPLKGGTIMFTEDFFLLNQSNKNALFELSFLDNLYSNPCIELSAEDFADVRKTIVSMIEEYRRTDSKPVILQSLLHILLAKVQRCIDAKSDQLVSKKYLILFKEFKNLLEVHYASNKTTSFFADQLSVTAHHLNAICKEITGKTATELIRTRKILEAKRYLSFTDQTISEITFALNFADSSYFTKSFKKETGITPVEFRKTTRANLTP